MLDVRSLNLVDAIPLTFLLPFPEIPHFCFESVHCGGCWAAREPHDRLVPVSAPARGALRGDPLSKGVWGRYFGSRPPMLFTWSARLYRVGHICSFFAPASHNASRVTTNAVSQGRDQEGRD